MQNNDSSTAEENFIGLDPDAREYAKAKARSGSIAFSTISQYLEQGRLTEERARTCLDLVFHHVHDISKTLGIQLESPDEIETRFSAIRTANQRVNDLEAQLGRQQGPEDVLMGLQHLDGKLRHWWRVHGFGHVSALNFTKYGVEVSLSCHLFGLFSLVESRTPVSDVTSKQAWHKQLEGRGFVLGTSKKERDPHLVDCAQTRETMTKLVKEFLPSGQILSFENHHRETEFEMTGLKLFIKEMSDVATLPEQPNE